VPALQSPDPSRTTELVSRQSAGLPSGGGCGGEPQLFCVIPAVAFGRGGAEGHVASSRSRLQPAARLCRARCRPQGAPNYCKQACGRRLRPKALCLARTARPEGALPKATASRDCASELCQGSASRNRAGHLAQQLRRRLARSLVGPTAPARRAEQARRSFRRRLREETWPNHLRKILRVRPGRRRLPQVVSAECESRQVDASKFSALRAGETK
jgi:hypothetical protein